MTILIPVENMGQNRTRSFEGENFPLNIFLTVTAFSFCAQVCCTAVAQEGTRAAMNPGEADCIPWNWRREKLLRGSALSTPLPPPPHAERVVVFFLCACAVGAVSMLICLSWRHTAKPHVIWCPNLCPVTRSPTALFFGLDSSPLGTQILGQTYGSRGFLRWGQMTCISLFKVPCPTRRRPKQNFTSWRRDIQAGSSKLLSRGRPVAGTEQIFLANKVDLCVPPESFVSSANCHSFSLFKASSEIRPGHSSVVGLPIPSNQECRNCLGKAQKDETLFQAPTRYDIFLSKHPIQWIHSVQPEKQ